MHSVLFKIGSVPIHAYGTMLATAFIVAILITHRQAHFVPGLKRDRVVDCVLFVLISSLLGARVMYVALNYQHFDGVLDMLSVQRGGLSFHGGLLGATLGLAAFAYFYKLPFWPLLDAITPAAALGYAVTKIGCFLNGCCYGRPADVPWACQFPAPTTSDPHALTALSHPVQIYDSLMNVAVAMVLLVVLRRKRYHGQVFQLWLVIYSITRIITEFFRKGVTGQLMFSSLPQDEAAKVPMLAWPPTQAQFASAIIIVVVGLYILVRLHCAPKERLSVPDSSAADPSPPAPPDPEPQQRRRRKKRPRPQKPPARQ